MPGGVGGSWGAGSGGCTPRGGPAPASPAPTAAYLPLSVAWPGGLSCPWNRGTVDTVACRESTRGKRQSQRSRPWIDCRAPSAQEPSWLARLRLGVGHAIYRPARSLRPGRGGRTRLPPRELLAARPRFSPQSACVNLSARRGPCRLGRGRPRRDEFRPGRASVLVTVVGRR